MGLIQEWITLSLSLCMACVLIFSVFAALPMPYDPRMEALNTNYIFRWKCDHTQANDNTTFMVEYTFTLIEPSYTSIRVKETWCDLSDYLQYNGEYTLRVRAESNGERSNWTWLPRFCPDEHADLSPPSLLRVEAGDGMVTVCFSESLTKTGAPMSSILKPMVFRLKYWDTNHPTQDTEKTIKTTHHTLSLEPGTQYCLQVQAISENYQKSSHYTQPQCVALPGQSVLGKMGDRLVTLIAIVVGVVIFSTSFIYVKNKQFTLNWKTPNSILASGLPLSHQSLLELEDGSCSRVTAVTAIQTESEQVIRSEIMVIQECISSTTDDINQEPGK